MKKVLSVLLTLSLLLGCSAALAEGMGVQVIGGPAAETEPVSLDNIKLNADVEIDGYAILNPTEFQFAEKLGYYQSGFSYIINPYNDYYESGADADYAILRMDITNVNAVSRNFLSSCEVKVIYDDTYEYGGWLYQSNYNNDASNYGDDAGKQNIRWVIDNADIFSIDPMYQGHYVFGCTLPNSVVNSKKPLRMVIMLDGNEITYNIRK